MATDFDNLHVIKVVDISYLIVMGTNLLTLIARLVQAFVQISLIKAMFDDFR
jgi:hypothetical protein